MKNSIKISMLIIISLLCISFLYIFPKYNFGNNQTILLINIALFISNTFLFYIILSNIIQFCKNKSKTNDDFYQYKHRCKDCKGLVFSISKSTKSRKVNTEQTHMFWMYLLKSRKCDCPLCIDTYNVIQTILKKDIAMPFPPYVYIQKGDRYKVKLTEKAYKCLWKFSTLPNHISLFVDTIYRHNKLKDIFIWEYIENANTDK